MSRRQIARDPSLPASRETELCDMTTGVVVLGIDFRSKCRERVYDADKIWSGEHTVLDYTEI